jgi:hypothetical protein
MELVSWPRGTRKEIMEGDRWAQGNKDNEDKQGKEVEEIREKRDLEMEKKRNGK